MYPVLDQLVKSVQTHKHRKTCEKPKVQGVDLKLLGHLLIKLLLLGELTFVKQEVSKAVLDRVLQQPFFQSHSI